MAIGQSDIDNWFTYHAPIDRFPSQPARYDAIRRKAKELAELFVSSSTASADQTAAVRKLRETVMAMNLAIACNETAKDPVT
jgi:hypothetical protein